MVRARQRIATQAHWGIRFTVVCGLLLTLRVWIVGTGNFLVSAPSLKGVAPICINVRVESSQGNVSTMPTQINASAMPLHTAAAEQFPQFPQFLSLLPLLKGTQVREKWQVVAEDIIAAATQYVVAAPHINNISCTTDNNPPKSSSCNQYPAVFARERRQVPNKLALLIQFGYDVDSLEIALHEYHGIVDKVFLIESTCNHQGLRKPLLWEMIKRSERFALFANVLHLLQDDVNCHTKNPVNKTKVDWGMEHSQERQRWARFLEWNAASGFFSETDVIGFGDVDEVPSRENLLLLKYCTLIVPKVDIGIWFPFGRLTTAFATDHPVSPTLPYSLGDPTFYLLSAAKATEFPNRQRGHSGSYLLGGMHMSFYGYLPQRIIQKLSCTECVGQELPPFRSARDLEHALASIPNWGARLVPLSSLDASNASVVSMPWFLNCNRDRFPMWTEGGHDTRIDALTA